MKLVPINLESNNLGKQLRDGLVYEVHIEAGVFTGVCYRDWADNIMFRPLRIPEKKEDDHHVHLNQVKRLMWHNTLIPGPGQKGIKMPGR